MGPVKRKGKWKGKRKERKEDRFHRKDREREKKEKRKKGSRVHGPKGRSTAAEGEKQII